MATVLAAADDVPHLQLADALEILILMARADDPRFDRAAARWVLQRAGRSTDVTRPSGGVVERRASRPTVR